MTLRDREISTNGHAHDGRNGYGGDAADMGGGETFTFDTENVDPAKSFHIPSMVTNRKLQRIAVKVARAHPDIVTVGDYQRVPEDQLSVILRDLGLPPREVKEFTHAIQAYVSGIV